MSKTSNSLFFGGIPTDEDVKKLEAAFGIPKEGADLPYAQVESVLHITRSENRWHSVTAAWRKKLWRTHNLKIACRSGEAFVCLAPMARVDFCAGRLKQNYRGIIRASEVARTTNRDALTPEARGRCDHYARVSATLRLAEMTVAKQITLVEKQAATA